jgi:quercetin dioxygenase-like cupin family protein
VLPPGTAVGFHEHPGDETGYVIKGSVIWKVRGQPGIVDKGKPLATPAP